MCVETAAACGGAVARRASWPAAARAEHGVRCSEGGDDASPLEPPPEPPPPSAAPKGAASTMEFQAETKKLLDIVANSLYTDKEVFVRELVSNASDALEKRHAALTSEGAEAEAGEAAAGEMQIRVTTDADANTLTIEDSGIGMTRDELIANLGTTRAAARATSCSRSRAGRRPRRT